MIEDRLVQKFGNGGHLILPKRYVGKKLKIFVETKNFYDITSDILDILNAYLKNVTGIYLYGSYARGEETIRSDIDILVITYTKIKIPNKIMDYSIVSTTTKEIEILLRKNAILILPIIKEAETIINPNTIEKYKGYSFNKQNTGVFIRDCINIFDINKKGLDLGFDFGSLVYSLILRIRGLLIIKLMLDNKTYYNEVLFSFLEEGGLSRKKIDELYNIYSKEKEGIKVRDNKIILREDIKKLLNMADKLLREVKVLLIGKEKV